jgi:maleate isomerase
VSDRVRVSSETAVRVVLDPPRRADLGFVLLATDEVATEDLLLLRPDPGVGIHITRVAFDGDEITPEALLAVGARLPAAAATLLPGMETLSVVCFGCTSASALIGPGVVRDKLEEGRPGARGTSLIASVMTALRFVGARRIALATPYIHEVNVREAEVFAEHGFEVESVRGFAIPSDLDVSKIPASSIVAIALEAFEAAYETNEHKPDAVVISCSQLRSVQVIDELEKLLGVPVITSNQAMMWNALRVAGLDDPVRGYGTLLARDDRTRFTDDGDE